MKTVRLGTRGSKLALAQSHIVKEKLRIAYPDLEFLIIPISTKGDLDLTSPLSEIGGKNVFIKELEWALLENRIDIAVHSLKDITSSLMPELKLSAFLQAEAVNDVLLTKKKLDSLDELPLGSRIATGSMRRRALLKKIRPDLQTLDIRGNVLTRIEKLENETFDGLILSEAGLLRLGLQNLISYRFDPFTFCPAPGQGVIALETRVEDFFIEGLCDSINDKNQAIKSKTELSFLERVHFDCSAPLGLYAYLEGKEHIKLFGFLASEKMDRYIEETLCFPIEERLDAAKVLSELFLNWRKST
ncbi:Porphobilinogen deaminase [Criblamydia sequanensis CRIB-18]|uniref:Hydroxymethylbilane synthase n=2 Tax=Candidatus Criblamydia sequanensis TaxID=340071 RepID=A0A090CXQ5_9BACT|nr:Porphobilinogen deaminase [Criblamydia sequanensis CRIB-18]